MHVHPDKHAEQIRASAAFPATSLVQPLYIPGPKLDFQIAQPGRILTTQIRRLG